MQNALNGIINVYKEKGYTSHDVVAKLRGILKMKKIGHTGTLDPEAEGVLPVCLGNATKLCEMLTDKEKTYRTVLILGIATDTEDMTGKVLDVTDPEIINRLKEDDIKKAVNSFVGSYNQIPPMYSAIKVDGKKLYELAREGKVVERKPRKVNIIEIKDVEVNLPRVSFQVTCSKGTYVRSLCRDIGEKLGICACMDSLLRTRVSVFEIKDALKLDEIESYVRDSDENCRMEDKKAENVKVDNDQTGKKLEKIENTQNIEKYIVSVEDALRGFGKIRVKKNEDKYLLNGNKLKFDVKRLEQIEFETKGESINLFDVNKILNKEGLMIRVYSNNGKFVGLYKRDEGDIFKPEKMFL